MKEGFASMQLRAMNVSKFDLLAQAPHSVAYNVRNVSTQGQVWNFFSSKTKLRELSTYNHIYVKLEIDFTS